MPLLKVVYDGTENSTSPKFILKSSHQTDNHLMLLASTPAGKFIVICWPLYGPRPFKAPVDLIIFLLASYALLLLPSVATIKFLNVNSNT